MRKGATKAGRKAGRAVDRTVGHVPGTEEGQSDLAGLRTAANLADRIERKASRAERRANLALWDAWTTGTPVAWRRMERTALAAKKVYSSALERSRVETLMERVSRGTAESLEQASPGHALARQVSRRLEILHNLLTEYGLPQELLARLTELEAETEQRFSTHRARLQGRGVTTNDLYGLLQTSTDRRLRQRAWEAQKSVGRAVAPLIRKLMRERNRAARLRGFPDFWHMQLVLSEVDPQFLVRFVEETERLTGDLWEKCLGDLRRRVSLHLAIPGGIPEPWDWSDPFFQQYPTFLLPRASESPPGDPVAAARSHFSGLGLDVEGVLSRSSLYEAPGKHPHAFCLDLDRHGDVRILCNVRNEMRWHQTVLHELGHAVYSLHTSRELPWILRTEAHSLTTEGVAMFCEGAASTAVYLSRCAGMSPEAAARVEADLAVPHFLSKLIFIRFCLVMVQFEKAAYEDPERDLDSLWWELVQRYQGQVPPGERHRPDWASKVHIATAPVYYHNYLLGECFASQLRKATSALPGGSYGPEVARFLLEKVFSPGRGVRWDRLVEQATGEPLTVAHLAAEIGKAMQRSGGTAGRSTRAAVHSGKTAEHSGRMSGRPGATRRG